MDPRRVETGERVALYTADQAAFEVLDIAVLAGRVFTAADHADAEPVAVVSATLAQRLGGTERALGTVVEALGTERRVVGVVADARLTGPRAAPHEAPQLYLPLAQRVNRTVSFAIRAATDDAEALLPDVRRSLAAVAPTSAIDWADSFESALGEGFARDRFLLALTGVFSVISVLLAALGLFALLSFSVARAQTEIGVRQVLGATRASVVLGIVRGGVSLVAVGLALGLALSLLLSRVLAGIVYGIRPLDALAFTGTAATLVAVGVLASALPAWRAAAVSPAQAIRSE
jgi:hypothetical protein